MGNRVITQRRDPEQLVGMRPRMEPGPGRWERGILILFEKSGDSHLQLLTQCHDCCPPGRLPLLSAPWPRIHRVPPSSCDLAEPENEWLLTQEQLRAAEGEVWGDSCVRGKAVESPVEP